ncbi:MAG: GDSL-type esterase/lipase family protein [Paracoccaceae bacterium]
MNAVPPSRKLCIAFLGDSITVGDGDARGTGWPARLMAATSPNPARMHCYNLGVGGNLIADVAKRCQTELAARLTGRDGAGTALMIGVNDALRASATVNTVPLDKSAISQNLSQIIRAAQLYGPVVVIETAPVLPSLVRDDGGIGEVILMKLSEVNSILGDVCASLNAPLILQSEALSKNSEFSSALERGDGLHPTADGYDVLAGNIADSPIWSKFLSLVAN